MQAGRNPWYRRLGQRFAREARWLSPGVGVKRWIIVLLLGTTMIGVGLAMLALDVYRNAPDTWWLPILSALSLRQLSRPIRVLIFAGIGLSFLFLGTWGLNRSLLQPFVRPGKPIFDQVTRYRRRERGPKVVAIGGGTGLSSLLRGLKEYTNNITAIVTVADDGGSSGELRRNMGILPPGDIRNCLAALSDDEELTTQLFKYRFGEGAGLGGHSLGNLLITALTDITGSFEQAVTESGRVLAVRGRVMPSTLRDVRLVADIHNPESNKEIRVRGESNIPTTPGKVRRVWLEPNNPHAYPPAIQAILSADLILIGPGSLYTSILPNLLVPDLAAAIKSSRGYRFYICNVATQPGETDGYNCLDHVRTLERHLNDRLFDMIICNSREIKNPPEKVEMVKMTPKLEEDYPVYCADLLDDEQPWRHDSRKLAQTVVDLYYQRTGPQTLREDDLIQ